MMSHCQDAINPHVTLSLEIQPGPHWWEASALSTAPPLLSSFPRDILVSCNHELCTKKVKMVEMV